MNVFFIDGTLFYSCLFFLVDKQIAGDIVVFVLFPVAGEKGERKRQYIYKHRMNILYKYVPVLQ